ncbi:hypothetical protein MXB_1341 [Myxobolus squamalis]|nr:hypothetical protein MXB_1341 [Myxobolus squamalis]
MNLNLLYGVGLFSREFSCTRNWLPKGMLASELNIFRNSIYPRTASI